MRDEMTATLNIYNWPSQAFWRYFELQMLRNLEYERPILEIGCGDGQFTALLFDEIDEAIDFNPRAVERCLRLGNGLYKRVSCADARQLHYSMDRYGTIYANSVLEHIPDIERVIQGCFHSLRPGGRLVTTVPLRAMNDSLTFRSRRYASVRQRQLAHVNLLTEEEWKGLLIGAGFSEIEFRPYLSPSACRLWDLLDAPGCLGFGRYRLAPILGTLRRWAPSRFRDRTFAWLAEWLKGKAVCHAKDGASCAALILARKPNGGMRS